jgi:uncharacterized protein
MMPLSIANLVAEAISNTKHHISIIWHGGEPLVCGSKHFKSLLNPFEKLRKIGLVTHLIQTNATLINDEFIKIFKEYEVEIGVSIDGPEWANSQRVNWNNSSSFDKLIQGINLLKVNKVPFGAIAVVNNLNITKAREIYDFFSKLGCHSLAINIEEQEGVNLNSPQVNNDIVYSFWKNLFQVWSENPTLNIREFSRGLSWIKAILNKSSAIKDEYPVDYFPSIAFNGDVVLLSPELLDTKSKKYNNFIVGNIKDNNLSDIVHNSKNINYIRDFENGLEKCKNICEYYSFCRGGQASNKFFELNDLNTTETKHCLRTKKILINSLVDNF